MRASPQDKQGSGHNPEGESWVLSMLRPTDPYRARDLALDRAWTLCRPLLCRLPLRHGLWLPPRRLGLTCSVTGSQRSSTVRWNFWYRACPESRCPPPLDPGGDRERSHAEGFPCSGSRGSHRKIFLAVVVIPHRNAALPDPFQRQSLLATPSYPRALEVAQGPAT